MDADTLVDKINAQVTHLGFGRKARPDEKLGSIDVNWLKPAIDSEIGRFEKLLNPECVKYWVKSQRAAFIPLRNSTNTTSAAFLMTVSF